MDLQGRIPDAQAALDAQRREAGEARHFLHPALHGKESYYTSAST